MSGMLGTLVIYGIQGIQGIHGIRVIYEITVRLLILFVGVSVVGIPLGVDYQDVDYELENCSIEFDAMIWKN